MSNESTPLGNEIDYSGITPARDNLEADWEAPEQVFFGKKDPRTGKIERKPPPYVYQEFPLMLYGRVEGRVRAVVVNAEAERDARLADGFVRNPAELGIVTCPTLEQTLAMRRAKEATEPELVTETVQVVRKPGRPRKAA